MAIGWGLDARNIAALNLMKVWLDVISKEECYQRFKKSNEGYEKYLHSKYFCTWTSGKDTCDGKYPFCYRVLKSICFLFRLESII